MSRAEFDVHLVACAAAKGPAPAPARDLYVSPLFRKAAAYAAAQGGPWFVLSALHGLVEPDRIVAPYDVTLADMTPDARRAWAKRVWNQIVDRGLFDGRLVFLAGRLYRDDLADLATCRGGLPWLAHAPMAGLGIGEQLAWLTRHAPKAAAA